MMSALTCVSCHVAFSTTTLHREHYKSDWHRYNLMRKVAELPPITYEIFEQRAAIQKQKLEEKESESESRSYCQICRKYFGTENALTNHLQSKKHLEAKDRQQQVKPSNNKPKIHPIVKKPIVSNELPQSEATSSSTDQLAVAAKEPEDELMEADDDNDSDWESVVDEGDLEFESPEYTFDGDALTESQCLFCGLESTTLEENVQHMSSSHSFFIPDMEYLTDLSGLVTYLGQKVGSGRVCLWCATPGGGHRFRSVQAVQQHMLDKGHCKMLHEGNSILEYTNFYNYSSSYPDGQNAGDDTEDEEVEMPTLDGDDWQLVLPSGATIGHRSLKVYFKQNIKPNRPITKEGKVHHMIHNLMHQYKALGWTGTTTSAAVLKAKDIRYITQYQAKQYMRLGTKANKFQPHLRPQVIF